MTTTAPAPLTDDQRRDALADLIGDRLATCDRLGLTDRELLVLVLVRLDGLQEDVDGFKTMAEQLAQLGSGGGGMLARLLAPKG